MAIWKEQNTAKKDATVMTPSTSASATAIPESAVQREPEHAVDMVPTTSPASAPTSNSTPAAAASPARRVAPRDARESVIASWSLARRAPEPDVHNAGGVVTVAEPAQVKTSGVRVSDQAGWAVPLHAFTGLLQPLG